MPVYQIFLSHFINPVHCPVLITEAALVFQMLVPLYQTILPCTPDDSNFHRHICKEIKSHTVLFGDCGGIVVKVLCYESEGCWFDPS